MDSRPSVKHVLGVLKWFYMLSEKILFQKSSVVFHYPRWTPTPGLAKDHKNTFFFRHPSLNQIKETRWPGAFGPGFPSAKKHLRAFGQFTRHDSCPAGGIEANRGLQKIFYLQTDCPTQRFWAALWMFDWRYETHCIICTVSTMFWVFQASSIFFKNWKTSHF